VTGFPSAPTRRISQSNIVAGGNLGFDRSSHLGAADWAEAFVVNAKDAKENMAKSQKYRYTHSVLHALDGPSRSRPSNAPRLAVEPRVFGVLKPVFARVRFTRQNPNEGALRSRSGGPLPLPASEDRLAQMRAIGGEGPGRCERLVSSVRIGQKCCSRERSECA